MEETYRSSPSNQSWYGMSKSTLDGTDPSFVIFESIEELEAASTTDEIDELMTVAVQSAVTTMYTFAETYRVEVEHPLYDHVANLSLLKMMCQFLYEVGYVQDDTVKLLDYCAGQFIAYEGLQRSIGEADKTPMEFGTSFSPEVVSIAARAPRKKVRYDFRNLSPRGRAQLPEFAEMEGSISNFVKQWLGFNKTDLGRLAIQAGLEAVPGIDVIRLSCALLPAFPKLVRTRILTRSASLHLTAFCAAIAGAGLVTNEVGRAMGLSRGNAAIGSKYVANEVAGKLIGKWVGKLSEFLSFTTSQSGRRLASTYTFAVLSVSLLRKARDDFHYIYKPQNKIAWTRKLIGKADSDDDDDIDPEAGDVPEVQSIVAEVDKYNAVLDFFKVGESLTDLKARFRVNRPQIQPFRTGQKRTEYSRALARIERDREGATRDFYIQSERREIDDMVAESSAMLSVVKDLKNECERLFAKLLQVDPSLDRFSTFVNEGRRLSGRPEGEAIAFKRAARQLLESLSSLELESEYVLSDLITEHFDQMKRLAQLAFGRGNPPLPLNDEDRLFVNGLAGANVRPPQAPPPAPAADGGAVPVAGMEDPYEDIDEDDAGAGVVPQAAPPARRQARRRSEVEELLDDGPQRARRQRTRSAVDDLVDAFLATRFAK